MDNLLQRTLSFFMSSKLERQEKALFRAEKRLSLMLNDSTKAKGTRHEIDSIMSAIARNKKTHLWKKGK